MSLPLLPIPQLASGWELATAKLISRIASTTMVLMRVLRECDELTTVASATPCLAVWKGLAAAPLISRIAASTMVLLRALRQCDELTMVAHATPRLAIWRGLAAAQMISGLHLPQNPRSTACHRCAADDTQPCLRTDEQNSIQRRSGN